MDEAVAEGALAKRAAAEAARAGVEAATAEANRSVVAAQADAAASALRAGAQVEVGLAWGASGKGKPVSDRRR